MLDRGWINRIAWHGQQRGIDHIVFVLLEDDVDDDDVARIQMLARTAYRHHMMMICDSHAKLHWTCRYEWLEQSFYHVCIWTTGDAAAASPMRACAHNQRRAAGLQIQ